MRLWQDLRTFYPSHMLLYSIYNLGYATQHFFRLLLQTYKTNLQREFYPEMQIWMPNYHHEGYLYLNYLI